MTTISRQLVKNIVASSVWSQLVEGHAGTAYVVPSSGSYPRADVKLLRAMNLSSGSAQVEFAFSSGSPPADDQYVLPRRTLLGYQPMDDDAVHVLRSGEAIWARVINAQGTPNITVRASLLEIS